MSDKDKKVVNTEEQNRAVNPADSENQEESVSQDPVTSVNESGSRESDKPDGGTEVDRPHRIEGDDAGSIERKVPNM